MGANQLHERCMGLACHILPVGFESKSDFSGTCLAVSLEYVDQLLLHSFVQSF